MVGGVNRTLLPYEQMLDHMPDAVTVFDLEGHFLFVNRSTCDRSGYTREELVGRHYSSLVPPSELSRVNRRIARRLLHLLRVLRYRRRTDRRTAAALAQSAESRRSGVVALTIPAYQSKAELDRSGPPFVHVLPDGDINGDRTTLKTLRLLIYEQVMDLTTIALAALDVEGHFIFVNRRACEMAGYTRHELLGRHYWSLLPPRERPAVTRHFMRVIQCRASVVETNVIRKDGHPRTVIFQLGPWVEHETIMGAVCTADDLMVRTAGPELLP